MVPLANLLRFSSSANLEKLRQDGRNLQTSKNSARLAARLCALAVFAQASACRAELPLDIPTVQDARKFVISHTDAGCDDTDNVRLIKEDRMIVASQSGKVATIIYDLYCEYSAARTRVFLLWRTFSGYRLMHFAKPVYELRWADDIGSELAEKPRAIGYEVATRLPNGKIDPNSLEITSNDPWGANEDAGEQGSWEFQHNAGAYSLSSFEVDPFSERSLGPGKASQLKGKRFVLFPPEK
ncbi:hypothetical protein [Methylocystis parvus]|uniref:DUF1176 domain-containing protein n=1 Tax=Methylocystis parvus TaxID=134 RepID=A0A6B8MEW0_9HYPH|nr:hypothetical protein [Methylocystis parvus]QGN00080.1 hypothetical protein F7D14_21085 [Methylocystis parvus]WBK02424.1 hypothetical protein MMG94_21560 [Methylocystis parvus OBBP]